ncbi:thiamin pyrophosphokinase 1 [Anthonomus grandis grandis]|uniref:thiamin pyrophosphokinase 1 n=1 Tax=Anthonomus grandis grandis TaxID=2921223 RepID=UPI002166A34B|nr:thiamin pyrophosphokinase 1 [Anthonomus grandis grandis]XP_050303127.1 thiamin pyrophosphokinase 1 [Anthonomus grandis grandis]XP_050303128.1 thiamin pyrophosphokinase 1 [Anthonomus grandis grandis]
MCSTNNHLNKWNPWEDFSLNFRRKKYAIMVLNTKINIQVDHRHMINLWTHAKLRITVDGGTSRWLCWLQDHECDESNILPPDLITGDMDSVPGQVLEYFKDKNAKIIKTPDQMETDFTKALRELKKYCETEKIEIDEIFVFGDTSGRFDQILANINTMYKATSFLADTQIYQIASSSITWVLTPGRHLISIPKCLRESNEWCALLPIGGPCIVSSEGLKWNLDKTLLTFSSLVSTSNTYSGEPHVSVTTDNFLTWSMGIEPLL